MDTVFVYGGDAFVVFSVWKFVLGLVLVALALGGKRFL